jgi:hypothetical protein
VPAQYNSRPNTGKSGRENGGPQVTAMVAMHDLDSLSAQKLGCAQDKPDFRQPFRRSRVKRDLKPFDDCGKFAPLRAGEPHFMSEFKQVLRELNTLVISPAASKERIQLCDPEWRASLNV